MSLGSRSYWFEEPGKHVLHELHRTMPQQHRYPCHVLLQRTVLGTCQQVRTTHSPVPLLGFETCIEFAKPGVFCDILFFMLKEWKK